MQMGLLQERQWAVKCNFSCQEICSEVVVKYKSIQILLADLELKQLDDKIVFLHDELEERIYLKQHEEYIQEGQENKVCLLKKSFYELNEIT